VRAAKVDAPHMQVMSVKAQNHQPTYLYLTKTTMTTESTINHCQRSGSAQLSASFNQFLSLLRRTLLMSFLMGLISLSGLFLDPALAMPTAAAMMPEGTALQTVDSTAKSDRTSAVLACLPKQLSQPDLKRTLSEMGNDQLERIFNLTDNPKLSQAETELKDCLNRKGFTS